MPPVASRRVLIDAEDFTRRRGVAALTRGDSLDLEEVPRRPNAALLGGLVFALLIAAGSAGAAFVTGRAPDGWRADGALVLDRQTGARFVADGGLLRPAPTLTSALLAGARSEPVLVPHEHVAGAPLGAGLPGEGMPERPPSLPERATGFLACVGSSGSIDVFTGAPRRSALAAEGLLVRTDAVAEVVLVVGRRAHPTSAPALAALGYTEGQVRVVPQEWLDLVPTGDSLTLLSVTAVDPTSGVPGVGVEGEVVAATGSGRHFLVADGAVSPLVNRTSELLAPAPVRTVPESVLLTAPAGPPVGVLDAPEEPPTVPAREDVVVPCVRSSDGAVELGQSVADAGTRPSAPRRLDTRDDRDLSVTWHFQPGFGALVGPQDLDVPVEAGEQRRSGGIRIVADGVGHEFADDEALRALGYRREQTVLLPPPWLALVADGVTLSVIT